MARTTWLIAVVVIVAIGVPSMSSAEESEKKTKKKGDMNSYLKRTAAKFIAETAKKEGLPTCF